MVLLCEGSKFGGGRVGIGKFLFQVFSITMRLKHLIFEWDWILQVVWELWLRPATTKILNPLRWSRRKAHKASISFSHFGGPYDKIRITVEYLLHKMGMGHVGGKRTSSSCGSGF